MPNRFNPVQLTKTNTSVNVLNVIRNNASVDYRNYIPVATPDAECIRNIGNIIMDYPALQNEFISALINRIGLVIVTSKLYENPLARFKAGKLELGETVEEVFVNLAKPFIYDAEKAETDQYKRELPDVRSSFHILNSKIFYKTSNSWNDLKQAFLSWDGVSNLITKTIESVYTSANYDEYNVIKYMIARRLLNGQMSYTAISDPATDSNLDDIAADIKAVSNDFTFLKTRYNPAGVYNHSEKGNQVLLVNSTFDAKLDVQVLAYAFNMSKAEVEARKVLFDGFDSIDQERLKVLFKEDDSFEPLNSDELAALANVPAILIDEEFFKIYDSLLQFETKYNGENMYWNHWLHKWNIYSTSPFANACAFIVGSQAVSAISVSPSTATLAPGDTAQFTATVTATAFANKAVTWSVGKDDPATITAGGLVTVDDDAVDADTITVTAKSVTTGTVTGTATITVDAS